MVYITKSRIIKAQNPHMWNIIHDDNGNVFLSYKTFAPGKGLDKDFNRKFLTQQKEVIITEWIFYKDIMYVSDAENVYKLSLVRANGSKIYTWDSLKQNNSQMNSYDKIKNKLGQYQHIIRIFL